MASRIALAVVALILSAELLLQVGSLFAPSRETSWRSDATNKILCVGDSHTWGAGLPREQSYPGQLQAFLDDAEPGVHSVINLGVPGRNTSQIRSRIPMMLGRYEPDVLVVWAGVNNSWNSKETDIRADSLVAQIDRLLFRSRLYQTVRVLVHDVKLGRHESEMPESRPKRKPRAEAAARNDPDGGRLDRVEEQAASDLAAIAEYARSAGTRVILLTYPIAASAFEKANFATWRVAGERELQLVQTRKSLGRVPRDEVEWLWAMHPGAAIYREIARDVAEVVRDPEAGYFAQDSPESYRELSRQYALLTLQAAMQVALATPPVTDAERAVYDQLAAFSGWPAFEYESRGIAPQSFATRIRDPRFADRVKPAAIVVSLRMMGEANGGTTEGELAVIDEFANVLGVSGSQPDSPPHGEGPRTKDLRYFLRRLRTLDHLPELEVAHTSLSSTWDRSGGNKDGQDFKSISLDGSENRLLDVDGPGCIHRIYTGKLNEHFANTRIQIVLDDDPEPIFDLPVLEFFDDREGPFPFPLVSKKRYPGILFPIPFEKHARVVLVSQEDGDRKWGTFWQIAYSHYPDAKVESLRWPLGPANERELAQVVETWTPSEKNEPPAPPLSWEVAKQLTIAPGKSTRFGRTDTGVIREMRVRVSPPTPEVLRALRLKISWDGAKQPSVDLPLGYFFGNADYGYRNRNRFSSLILGLTAEESYSRFPMPFAGGAEFELENRGAQDAEVSIQLDVESLESLPPNWGRFHATWTEQKTGGGHSRSLPKFGKQQIPAHVVLDRAGVVGKYVGALLHVFWPYRQWWGEGDWLIWTDEDGWPPSYHGTGSEEYFNSGFTFFARNAVSGFIGMRPGDVNLYSFHLNDAFQFRNNVRVAVEIVPWIKLEKSVSLWGSTAFWYERAAQDAGSRADLIPRPRSDPRP